MKDKTILIIIGIIVVIGLVYAYDVGGIKTSLGELQQTLNEEEGFVTMEQLHNNAQEYYGREVVVKGTLQERVGGYTLKDRDGYFIWIGNNDWGAGCIEGQRDYSFDSKTYTAKGSWNKAHPCEFGICLTYKESHDWLECVIPID